MISPFIEALYGIGLTLTAEEIADILWLASHLDKPPVQKEEAISQPPDQEPEKKDRAPSPISSQTQDSETKPPENAVYPRKSKGTGGSGIGGLAFRSPGASALPGKLTLGRAFRPFMRRVPSRTHEILDEEATAIRTAEVGNPKVIFPVFSPARSRWLDVMLVVDESPSMIIWQQTIGEFQRLLECQGAFRNVQTWGFALDPDGSIYLHAGTKTQAFRQGSRRSPRELIDPNGQRLLLVLSDCVSQAWEDGRVAHMLQIWAEKNYVVLVQVLPQRLWDRSALGKAIPIFLRTLAPTILKSGIEPQGDDLITQESDKQALPDGVSVPLMTLEARTIFPWAQAVLGKKEIRIPGRFLRLNKETNLQEETVTVTSSLRSPEEHVQLFRGVASPLAWELIGYLAAVPLSLPVMRLVQHIMLPEARQTHLAEVFLSGLIKRIVPEDPSSTTEEVEYDFLDGVRDILLSKVLVNKQVEVLTHVSHFIDQETGNPIDFRAMIADPTLTEQILIERSDRRFASIATYVLHRLGGNYARLAERLEQSWEEEEQGDGETGQVIEIQKESERIEEEVFTLTPLVPKGKHLESPETHRIDKQSERKKSKFSEIDKEFAVDRWSQKQPQIKFVDRLNEIAFITNIYCPPYLLINAPVGYGKSRLLENVRERLQQQDWRCLYLRLSRDKRYSIQELAHLLLEELGIQGSEHLDLSTPERAGDTLSKGILTTRQSEQKNVVILLDEVEALEEKCVKQFLNQFLPGLKEGLSNVEMPIRLRLICTGRQLTHWKQWATQIPLELLSLTPFDFRAVHETVEKFVQISDLKMNPLYRQDFAAYLMYFTGGHPGCMMKILSPNYGMNIGLFVANEAARYQTIIKPVIEEIQEHIPDHLHPIFERLSVFRMYSYPLLQKMLDQKLIIYDGNAMHLEGALTATYLVSRKYGFIQDDILRRLFAIKLRKENSDAFIDLCGKAQQIMEAYLHETTYQPHSVALEALFLELQLGYYASNQTPQARQALSEKFFAENGILQNYLNILLKKPEAYDNLQNLMKVLQDRADWEFQFTLNFFLRTDEHYTDEPYQRLLKEIERFVTEMPKGR